ncbi:universal stress protein [Hymenobacter sp. 5317J-9]|uniref:universal stress protein n=1 Tax=Hymenobacter sp. 5317J-9 TaxID=2932250 RepID=UPI001FD6F8E6|nr:universal stress protein [Hymenobacter sp. 5317J-9]UOQ96491.1 universal stress protein [Hymenobacter sp. 5317J-9]
MKNILVPTDFSAESHHAFEVAVRLAARIGGRVLLLHAIELPETANFSTYGGPVGGTELPNSSDPMEDVFVIKLLQATKTRLHRLLAEAAALAPGVPVQEFVQAARLSEALASMFTHQTIDLVVIGAQGHTAAEHFFFGSNTERLVRTAPCPVLAVKHPVEAFEVQRLVFPSDFSAEADRAVSELRRVQALFPEAVLHLLNVVASAGQEEAAREKITAFASRHQLRSYEAAVTLADRPSEGITRYAYQVQADLVLLPTHGRTGLSRFLQASIAENVATHAFPPVLTFQLN